MPYRGLNLLCRLRQPILDTSFLLQALFRVQSEAEN